MQLKQILKGVTKEENLPNIKIEKLTFDTNQDLKNSLFFCLKGSNTDGHDFIEEAKGKGAIACVVEKYNKKIDILQILVSNTRQALALCSSNFFCNPSKALKIIGVTGTNGKTSTCLILKEIFEKAGHKSGSIGTLGYFISNENFSCDLTTPDPIILHKIFQEMKNQNVEYVFMEVSAHAIFFNKVYGINFLYGILTNITQDHLDFFKTMENYKNTKLKFLKSSNINMLILNADCESFDEFHQENVVTYGLTNPADTFAVDLSLKLGESDYILNVLDNISLIHTKLSGLFNVYNVLCASTVAILEGISISSVAKTLNEISDINGRFNIIHTQNGEIIIDFAHTPDGLLNILNSVKKATYKDIICVFGCNGNRDRLKRSIMGKIAEEYCQKVILTEDNPRFENAELIVKDILSKVKENEKFTVILDRTKAIYEAIRQLEKDKIVVICGKGGEKYQDINGIKVPYEDSREVDNALAILNIKKV